MSSLRWSTRSCTLGIAALALSTTAEAQSWRLKAWQKISETQGGFGGVLDLQDHFGWSLARLGDLDGDGVSELAVGATGDDDGPSSSDRGAVWILFLNADGTVRSEQKISATAGGFGGILDPNDSFGSAVAGLGDLDGDGIPDLAVGAVEDEDGGSSAGAVWILFLRADGTVRSQQKISATAGGFGGGIDHSDRFGGSIASLGDLDGDGIMDLAVGASWDDFATGEVWILFLRTNGTVRAKQRISELDGGFTGDLDREDFFGNSVAALGDLDGDGIEDLAVGANRDDDGGSNRGALWIFLLNANGTVKAQRKLSALTSGLEAVTGGFGRSAVTLGDLDGDGRPDLAVGAPAEAGLGSIWIVLLNGDGTPKSAEKLGGTSAVDGNGFALSLANLGDLDGEGHPDLAASAWLDDDGVVDQGAAWILFLERECVTLDFETDDEGAPLAHGQHLGNGDPEFDGGALFPVTLTSSVETSDLATAAILDSDTGPASQDPDLLVGRGNLLILQTDANTSECPPGSGIYCTHNDDEDGGTLTFAFPGTVEPMSVVLIDIDASDGTSSVVLTDGAGARRTYAVPASWTGDLVSDGTLGWRALDLTTLADQPGFASIATASEDAGFDPTGVVVIAIHLDGSGGVDDLAWCPSFPHASLRPRNGSGVNRVQLSSGALPLIGADWSASLDCREFGNGTATLTVRRRATSGALTIFGEELIAGTLLHRTSQPTVGLVNDFTWHIPGDSALIGLDLHVQGICWSAAPALGPKTLRARGGLSNALDLMLGF